MLADLSLRAALDAFASSDPTPGGGSAAALAGALGASLLAMVAGIPAKTATPEDRAALDAARARLNALRDTLTDLIDRDAAAYDLVVAAYKRPKATEADKTARKAAIQEALATATSVPLETFKACTEAMEAAGVVAQRGNPSAISDVLVGFSSLSLGMQGAALNVEINLKSVTDSARVEAVTQEMRRLTRNVQKAAIDVYGNDAARELMSGMAQRGGSLHGPPPDEGSPEFKEMVAAAAAAGLLRLGTAEAQQALDLLAASADPIVAKRVAEVRAKFGSHG